jgi:predicted NBD/HSP70 family sugar kinase
MEFGHMTYVPDGALCRCGRRGCIEAYAADYAMSRRAFPDAERARGIEAVVAAARAGNADALAAIETAARALGTGLASLFALMDRLPVALVGSGVAAFEFMERPIRELLEGEGGDGGGPIDIGCFTDEMPIIHQGCAISALLALDGEITRLQQSRERSAIRASS